MKELQYLTGMSIVMTYCCNKCNTKGCPRRPDMIYKLPIKSTEKVKQWFLSTKIIVYKKIGIKIFLIHIFFQKFVYRTLVHIEKRDLFNIGALVWLFINNYMWLGMFLNSIYLQQNLLKFKKYSCYFIFDIWYLSTNKWQMLFYL